MHWLVSLPQTGSRDDTWSKLTQIATYNAPLAECHKFSIPELKVGTLDSLMVLSDDLVKVNSMLEGVVNKIRRQMFDLAVGGDDGEEAQVEGMPAETYMERFSWDEAKYPPRRPLKETVSAVTDIVAELEDSLKVRVSEYNQLKGQLAALTRKRMGTLVVRDLANLVEPDDVISTENLMTLFVVVPKSGKAEWNTNYERLSDYVVPRSSKLVTEDNDYALYRVALFKRVSDSFKSACRSSGYQVREWQYDKEEQKETEASNEALENNTAAKKKRLEQWSLTAYGEAFSAWIHVCAIRLFVESILRYGLPPKFVAAILKPNPKHVTKLRKALAAQFGGGSGFFEGEEKGAALLAMEGDMFPYVSFTVAVD